MVTVYTCLKIYLYKKSMFIFVNNVTFFSMLYHGAVENVANTWICAYMILGVRSEQVSHFSVTSRLKSRDPFFLAL